MDLVPDQQTLVTSDGSATLYGQGQTSYYKQTAITNSIVIDLIAGYNLPLHITESPKFRIFSETFDNRYCPPCYRTIFKTIDDKVKKHSRLFKLLTILVIASLLIYGRAETNGTIRDVLYPLTLKVEKKHKLLPSSTK